MAAVESSTTLYPVGEVPAAFTVVNAPVAGVVAPTVPLIGPAKPVDVSIVPLNVKLAESVSRPPVVEYTTRPDVRPVLVMDVDAFRVVNAPARGVDVPMITLLIWLPPPATVPLRVNAPMVLAVNVVPLKVKLAELVSRPPVVV